MKIVVFDMDGTILKGDSETLWMEFLERKNKLTKGTFASYYDCMEKYANNECLIFESFRITAGAMSRLTASELFTLRSVFARDVIKPILFSTMMDRIDMHRRQGDLVIIATATMDFLAEYIIKNIIQHYTFVCTETQFWTFIAPKIKTPCFREEKYLRVHEYLFLNGIYPFDISTVYTDSINDIKLLENCHNPVAVMPTPALRKAAEELNWEIIDE